METTGHRAGVVGIEEIMIDVIVGVVTAIKDHMGEMVKAPTEMTGDSQEADSWEDDKEATTTKEEKTTGDITLYN